MLASEVTCSLPNSSELRLLLFTGKTGHRGKADHKAQQLINGQRGHIVDYPVHKTVMAFRESYGVFLTFSLTGIDRNVVSGKLTTRFFPSKPWKRAWDAAPLRRQKEENREFKATLGYKYGKPVLYEALSQTNKQTNEQLKPWESMGPAVGVDFYN